MIQLFVIIILSVIFLIIFVIFRVLFVARNLFFSRTSQQDTQSKKSETTETETSVKSKRFDKSKAEDVEYEVINE